MAVGSNLTDSVAVIGMDRVIDAPIRVLAIDVGAGTQDILVYDASRTPENCFKMVLPSQTQVVAARIRTLTSQAKTIHLDGPLMGGGASTEAILAHIAAGMRISATPSAAATVHNDLNRVRASGVVIRETPPKDAEIVRTGDVDLHAIANVLGQFAVAMPLHIAVAVQDHGYRAGEGNNDVRFEYLQSLLDEGGELSRMVFDVAPSHMNRMSAVLGATGGGIVMDTGAAAVLGALGDPAVRAHAETDGVVLVNVGNMHTFATLLRQDRLYGLFEHHTGGITVEIIARLVAGLQSGTLDPVSFRDSFDGHGAAIHPEYRSVGPFTFVAITGPNRSIAKALDYHEAAPFGDMMLTGAYGLAEGTLLRLGNEGVPAGSLFGK